MVYPLAEHIVGAWIRERREEREISQFNFAKFVDQKYYAFISQVERGKERVPTEDMPKWAFALDVSPQRLALVSLAALEPVIFVMLFPEGFQAGDPDLEADIRETKKVVGR